MSKSLISTIIISIIIVAIIAILIFVISVVIQMMAGFRGNELLSFGLNGPSDINSESQQQSPNPSGSITPSSGGQVQDDCVEKYIRQVNPNITSAQAKNYAKWANQYGNQYRVDPALLLAQIEHESINFNPNAVSPAGAQGLAQFMPDTWAQEGLDANGNGKNPFDPEDSIKSQASYMSKIKNNWLNSNLRTWENTLAAYNAGAGAVNKHNGIPPYPETQNYVTSIMNKYSNKYGKCKNSTIPQSTPTTNSGEKNKKLIDYAKSHTWGQQSDATGCYRADKKLVKDALGLDTDDLTKFPPITDTSLDQLKARLDKDQIVIWQVKGEYSGTHWVIVTGIDGNNIKFLDPVGKGSERTLPYDYYVKDKGWKYFDIPKGGDNSGWRGIAGE